ncbi:MAG: DUF1385 domain-containing protein [Candidatus Coatesbacteria bacterium]|nr:DUF1385 domain-containing protein [Candidatus Coatesbacteria bacterium]
MPLTIGGQAVIEGVMLRSPNAVSVSVRKADGSIKSKVERIKQPSQRFVLFKWPFFRGIATLWDSLSLGIKCLNFSAHEALADDSQKPDRKRSVWPFVFSFLAALGMGFVLFFLIPLLLSGLLSSLLPVLEESSWLFNLVDGVLRLIIFLIYVVAISMMPDIRRVFQYHGAEHRVVHAYEAHGEVTTESARQFGTLHRRCGTSFLLILLVIVILLFSLLPHEDVFHRKAMMRALFLPVVLVLAAGLSYELLRLSARARDSRIARVLTAPGLLLQKLVTRIPTDEQVEVAIASLNGVLAVEEELREARMKGAAS